LGSELYLGDWFIFLMIVPIGFGIPYLVIRFYFHENISDYGFSLGDHRFGALLLLILIPAYIFVPLSSAAVGTEKYYTMLVNHDFLRPLYVAVHVVSYALFAFGFEFLFRGFVLFGINSGLGNTTRSKWIAAIVSSGLSAIALIGLPVVFPISALVGGMLGALVNFRLRSMFYTAFIHWNMGVWSDIWEIIKM